jgi:uncharacterized coiled-coil protein SlyX
MCVPTYRLHLTATMYAESDSDSDPENLDSTFTEWDSETAVATRLQMQNAARDKRMAELEARNNALERETHALRHDAVANFSLKEAALRLVEHEKQMRVDIQTKYDRAINGTELGVAMTDASHAHATVRTQNQRIAELEARLAEANQRPTDEELTRTVASLEKTIAVLNATIERSRSDLVDAYKDLDEAVEHKTEAENIAHSAEFRAYDAERLTMLGEDRVAEAAIELKSMRKKEKRQEARIAELMENISSMQEDMIDDHNTIGEMQIDFNHLHAQYRELMADSHTRPATEPTDTRVVPTSIAIPLLLLLMSSATHAQ